MWMDASCCLCRLPCPVSLSVCYTLRPGVEGRVWTEVRSDAVGLRAETHVPKMPDHRSPVIFEWPRPGALAAHTVKKKRGTGT